MEPRRSRRPRCRCFRPSGFIEPITSDSEILKKKNRLQRSALFVYRCCEIQGISLGIAKPCFRSSGFIEPITSDSEILKKEQQITKVNFICLSMLRECRSELLSHAPGEAAIKLDTCQNVYANPCRV
jgi:hypothetical protein